MTASPPDVERDDDGFTVSWTSPSAGEISFGSTGPFTVDGEDQPLADFPRHESAFGTVDRLARRYRLRTDGARLDLDFEQATRVRSA